MTTLIVGCGYLGRRVGRLLKERGERVLGTVRSEASAVELQACGIEPILAEVTDPKTLKSLPHVERLFYCVGFDRSAGIAMRTVYVDGLKNVLDRYDGQKTRFVYASSTGVYGQSDGSWVDENSPTEPKHESGLVCLEAERLIRSMRESAVILRFAGLYGPGRIVRRDAIARGEPIAGDPEKWLTLIHIDDAASATVAALTSQKDGAIYTIADDRPVRRREYYGVVANILNAPEPVFTDAKLETTRDETNKRVSNLAMKNELGVNLRYPDITTGVPSALSEKEILPEKRG